MRESSAGGQIFSGALQRIGHMAADLGKDIVVGGVKLLASSLRDATKAAMEFETEAGQVQTIADNSVFSMQKIEEVTSELASLYGAGPTAGARALYDAISAGATTAAQATSVLHVASRQAVGGNGELSVSINGLTNAMNAYAVQSLTAADASDVFFTAVEQGKTTIPELASQIGNVAPIASSLGIQFHELGAAISAIFIAHS